MRPLNLQVIHQLEGVFGAASSVGRRFVAQAMIAVIKSNDSMILCQRRGDACIDKHPLGSIGEAMDQNHPALPIPHDDVVEFHAIRRGEVIVFRLVLSECRLSECS